MSLNKKIKKEVISRKKNILMIGAIISLFLNTARIDPTMLTDWSILWKQLVVFASNPYLVFTFVGALIGIIMNPTTRGVRD